MIHARSVVFDGAAILNRVHTSLPGQQSKPLSVISETATDSDSDDSGQSQTDDNHLSTSDDESTDVTPESEQESDTLPTGPSDLAEEMNAPEEVSQFTSASESGQEDTQNDAVESSSDEEPPAVPRRSFRIRPARDSWTVRPYLPPSDSLRTSRRPAHTSARNSTQVPDQPIQFGTVPAEGEPSSTEGAGGHDIIEDTPAKGVCMAATEQPQNLTAQALIAEALSVAELAGEPATMKEALSGPHGAEWQAAIKSEYDSLIQNGTWRLEPLPAGRKPVTCKWVFKTKLNPDGSVARYKARLVARGFSQRAGLDYQETFSPVVRFTSIRVLMSFVAQNDLVVHHMDVKTAFLHGKLEEEVYMQQPEGYVDEKFPNYVCRLIKTLYGLKQASRAWFETFSALLKSLGFIESDADMNVYLYTDGDNFVIIALYVDDALLITNSPGDMLVRVKGMLQKHFEMTDLGVVWFFLGVQILLAPAKGAVIMHQAHYIDLMLETFNMEDAKPVSTPLAAGARLSTLDSPETETAKAEMQAIPYRKFVGFALYLLTRTRFDLSQACGSLSQFVENPGTAHWTAGKRVMHYLKGTRNLGLCYRKDRTVKKLFLQGYTDADWGGDPDTRRSVSAYCFMLAGAAVSWQSKKQTFVSTSTTEAEYGAAAESCKEAVANRRLLADISQEQTEPTPVFCDNQSALLLASNPVYHAQTKHIDLHLHYVRQAIAWKEVALTYVPTNANYADLLTKPLSRERHESHVQSLGMVDITPYLAHALK